MTSRSLSDVEDRLRSFREPSVDPVPVEAIVRRARTRRRTHRLATAISLVVLAGALLGAGLLVAHLGSLGGGERAGAGGCSPTPARVLHVTARGERFDTTCLGAPAGAAFRIVFRNVVPDQPRNISIFTVRHPCTSSQAGDGLGASSCDGTHRVFLGRFVGGPRTVTYRVPALAPGTYYFLSEVLPDKMHGNLIVR